MIGRGWMRAVTADLRRHWRHFAAASVGVVLGVAALIDSVGTMLGVEALAQPGLYIYLVLAPIWALWLGIDLWRKPVQLEMA